MAELPTGTITFLFTDIEGSTLHWERYPEEMQLALARHDEIMRKSIQTHRGAIFKTVGDAFYASFTSAKDAVLAAVNAQVALSKEAWSKDIGQIRVRVALNTGEVEYRDNDYFGQPLNRVARLLSAGYGGQILLSQSTVGLVRDKLPPGIILQDLGTHRLKDIQMSEQIFQLTVSGLQADFPPLKTLDQHPNNLPTYLTPFIGRKKDLEAISRLLQHVDRRLITLLGPAGCGKTRLSLQVAAEIAYSFPDGVYFVDLANVRDNDGVINVLAQAIGLYSEQQYTVFEEIKKHLRGKVLLLIDNFEHVVETAVLIHEMLLSLAQLKVLVTSRSALHLAGEQEYRVGPLTVPDDRRLPTDLDQLLQYEAIVLFLQQARSVVPEFVMDHANAPAIAEICVKLDGLPLAIELAAVRVNLLPPQSMVKRLGRRFALLTGGRRNLSDRQQTLHKAIAWSYNLLNQQEKEVFCQLSVFSKGSTLEAIESTCQLLDGWDGEILELLHSLIDKNLMRLREQEDGEPRFEMLYTMREYALEQLTAEALGALQSRHAEYYLALAEQLGPPPVGVKQRHWLARLDAEYENMQLALHWYSEHGKIESGLRLACAFWHFWWLRGHLSEGQRWFEKLLAVAEEENVTVSLALKGRALERASLLACSQRHLAIAQLWADEALKISQQLDDKETMSKVYVALANIAMHQGERQRVITFLEASLKLRQATGDVRGMASLLNNLGNVARQEEKLERAATLHKRSLTYFRQLGDEIAIAAVLNNLAEVELQLAHYEQAQTLYTQSLKLCQKIQYTWGIASSLVGLGDVAQYYLKYEDAKRMYKEGLQIFREIDNETGVNACITGITKILAAQEVSEDAGLQAEVVGYSLDIDVKLDEYPILIDKLRQELGDTVFDALNAGGYISPFERSIFEAFNDI